MQPADQFYRNKHTTDKLESQCKQCKRSALQNVTSPTVESKKCSKCGLVRAASCFDRYKRTSDGLQSQCKDCMKVSGSSELLSRLSSCWAAYTRVACAIN